MGNHKNQLPRKHTAHYDRYCLVLDIVGLLIYTAVSLYY